MDWTGIAAIFAAGAMLGAAWITLLFGAILARQFGFPFWVGVRACAGYVLALINSAIRRFPPDVRGK